MNESKNNLPQESGQRKPLKDGDVLIMQLRSSNFKRCDCIRYQRGLWLDYLCQEQN